MNILETDVRSDSSSWTIKYSETRGRGLFANRDIKGGEIIFVDSPLLIGPRTGTDRVFCVNCFSTKNVSACSKKCGLPVCSRKCEKAHRKECEFIASRSKKQLTQINFDIFRCLTPLRGLLLNNERLLELFKSHEGLHHGFEVEILKRYLRFNEGEELLLRSLCSVLDTNTFEVIAGVKSDELSVRGLYPLSSMLNHSCTPNISHYFDSHQKMTVKASMPIKKGDEICHSYTKTFWGTCVRQPYLRQTKHFSCVCFRCQDPTECGSNLCAINCTRCTGVVLPSYDTNANVIWRCLKCNFAMPPKLAGVLLAILGSRLTSLLSANPIEIFNFLKHQLPKYAPMSNQVAVQLKLRLVWLLGYQTNYLWNDLSDDLLKEKEEICRELLKLLEMLRAGQSKMRGLILYELYRCMQEWKRRYRLADDHRALLEEAKEILKDDVNAPKEIQNVFHLSVTHIWQLLQHDRPALNWQTILHQFGKLSPCRRGELSVWKETAYIKNLKPLC
ncbi:SET domain-containing protein SmydA-8-like isoform X3 [Photinus pyralis]|nr:SET domain-containing protein SmydA-8-like isoform X3 [Photinus pyralis]